MRRFIKGDMSESGRRQLDFSEEKQSAGQSKIRRCNRAERNQRLRREPEELNGDDVQRSGLADPANTPSDRPRCVLGCSVECVRPIAPGIGAESNMLGLRAPQVVLEAFVVRGFKEGRNAHYLVLRERKCRRRRVKTAIRHAVHSQPGAEHAVPGPGRRGSELIPEKGSYGGLHIFF